jgi:hypothetical protein
MPESFFFKTCNEPKQKGIKMQLKDALNNQTIKMQYKELFAALNIGAYNGTAELIQAETYDRFTITAADVTAARKEFKLFTGVQGTSKTIIDTNFEGSGVVPQGQHYQIKALSLVVAYQDNTPPTAAVLQELLKNLENSILRVTIANKAPTLIIPLSRLLGMSLMSMATNTTTVTDSTFRQISNGVYAVNIPVVLPALTSFEMAILFQDAVTTNMTKWSFRLEWQSALVRGL